MFRYNTKNGKSQIKMHPNNDLVVSSINQNKGWEKTSLELWTAQCQKNPDNHIILDIGAYSGIYALLAAANSNSLVYAVEPFPANFSILKSNVELNDFNDRIATISAVLSSKTGSQTFHITGLSANPSGSSVDPHPTKKTQKQLTVNSYKGDDLFLSKTVGVVKIDVERHEMEVLKGMKSILRLDTPWIIIEILDEPMIREVYDFCVELGYDSFYAVDERGVLFDMVDKKFKRLPNVLNYIVYSAENV